MDSSGHYFSEYGNSKRYNDWRKQHSDGSNRVLQLRFRQAIRCGTYGFALTTNISFLRARLDFYGRIDKSERITVPNLTLKMLEEENQSLTGAVMEITIEPA